MNQLFFFSSWWDYESSFKKSQSGNSRPSIVKDGFKGILPNVLSQVYQKVTPRGKEGQMGRSWCIVVVGSVSDNPQKEKYTASVFGMMEYHAPAEGCFIGMQCCMGGEVMEHKRLALGVVKYPWYL